MKRCKLIVNPAAGKGAAGRKLPRLLALAEGRGLEISLALTTGPWHAAEIARAAALDGFAVVAAAGGDGTCNEVVNGLMEARQAGTIVPLLAVLPIGRGNDFAYGLGVPRELERAVAVLAGESQRPIDVGRITGGAYPAGRYFGNGVGIGFDTLVGLEAAKMKRLGGAPAYAWAALRLLVTFSGAPLVRLAHDQGELTLRAVMVSLMNGRRMGGAFHMAPAAVNDDGLLDLCAAEKTTRLQMAGLFGRYLRGTQAASRFVTTLRSRRIVVEAIEGSLAVHADGETICTDGGAITVECLPRQLEVLVPSSAAFALVRQPAEDPGGSKSRSRSNSRSRQNTELG
ncbi:MAG: diacylglycerol kinase family protein [Acidobacteriota bacterium]